MNADTGYVVFSAPLTRQQVEALPLFCCVVSPLVLVGAVLVACLDAWWRRP